MGCTLYLAWNKKPLERLSIGCGWPQAGSLYIAGGHNGQKARHSVDVGGSTVMGVAPRLLIPWNVPLKWIIWRYLHLWNPQVGFSEFDMELIVLNVDNFHEHGLFYRDNDDAPSGVSPLSDKAVGRTSNSPYMIETLKCLNH